MGLRRGWGVGLIMVVGHEIAVPSVPPNPSAGGACPEQSAIHSPLHDPASGLEGVLGLTDSGDGTEQ